MSTSNDPLWLLIAMAYDSSPNAREGAAAALRVIADAVVPEEPSETFLPGEDHHHRSKRQQRRHLRATLLEEANRAEAGE
ncbi:hypothetical protein SCBWM1_gp56 [Synechococcus phage S-CBWM1]|uniref:Uncharacterized protein n=1 Tax=Synechococcus phage S-CBWM1 TaxID=2053653 RepID=A0A3G1L3M1_9CAUD|nr:hypothetical protein HOU61_gp141 [Synechococcus phage S-CBWM1]ATW62740.1 hypothetical protein SCBWM1_gp56 [Synechococcus phage S-CBWM1]